MDTRNTSRPERMTAIVGYELARCNIDVAALSETRLAGTGDLTKVGAGYTFFWSGKGKEEPREAGVGFAVRSTLVPQLETLPKGISDRLMTMHIPLAGKAHLTLISCYAPTMVYSDERKKSSSTSPSAVSSTQCLNMTSCFCFETLMHEWEGTMEPGLVYLANTALGT